MPSRSLDGRPRGPVGNEPAGPDRADAWSRMLDPADEGSARRFAEGILVRLAALAAAAGPPLDAAGSDPVSARLAELAELMGAIRRADPPQPGWDPWLGLPRNARRRHPAVQYLHDFRRLGTALLHAHEALGIERARLLAEREELASRRAEAAAISRELDEAVGAGESVLAGTPDGFRAALDHRLGDLRGHRAMLSHQQAQLDLAAANLEEVIWRVDGTSAETVPVMLGQLAAAIGLLRLLVAELPASAGERTSRSDRLDRLAAAAGDCCNVDALRRLFARLCGLIDRWARPE